MSSTKELPSYFVESISVLTESQKELCIQLYANLGQEHLFDSDFFGPAAPPSQRRQLAAHLETLDEEYIDGGLKGYIENARKLLSDSKNGVNPLEGWKPSVPKGQIFDIGTRQFKEAEAMGLQEIGRCGFVLVAGGLGERLGYSGIKLSLPTEMTTGTCYLQFYIEYILSAQKRYAPPGRKLPLCIMTSIDTNDATEALLKRNNHFGMDPSQITIVQQGQGVPALLDNQARIAHKSKSEWFMLQTKPHGHGDIHSLMHSKGVAKQWLNTGTKWMVFFQDTNGLAFHSLPLMLGVSKRLGFVMNSMAVPRKAKQAVGGIALLTKAKTGEKKTINVEYNQLDPMLRASGFEDGDVNDKITGYSPYPGNINQLLFSLKPYVETLEKTKGLMPEFVNPKYKDEAKTEFKKPTRLECMMQDFPTVLDAKYSSKVGFTSIAASLCFSPVKNNIEEGAILQKKGTHPGTAASGEADQYGAQREILENIGCNIESSKREKYAGIAVFPGPCIVLKPDFVLSPSDYEQKFPFPTSVSITSRSTLVVRGSGVVIESLHLDGTLIIDYPDGKPLMIRDMVVQNAGWVRIADEESDNEIIKMRGYHIEKRAEESITPPSSCVII